MSVILDNPLAKKNLWLVGFPALQNSTVVYWDAYKTMEGGIPSRRNTVGHLYFAKVFARPPLTLCTDQCHLTSVVC